jgi:hypothetical protein
MVFNPLVRSFCHLRPPKPWRRWVSGCNGHCEFVLGAEAKARLYGRAGKTLSDWRSQAGVTTVSAEALAKAEQLTFVRVMGQALFISLVTSQLFYIVFIDLW